ncbi:MAG TPA: cation diffusion facilitator family transporter [Acidobacteriaceae bacterium]|nr:cation diffusion facilitator family transporter [Acidobacteriaceae bacterium]
MKASLTPEQMVEGGLRSSLLGIVINLGLALVKCLAGFVGHSFALLADGIESFLDVVSSTIVYLGLRLAIKPPDKDHPYGHGKADPIAAMVVGIAAQAINLIRTPHRLPYAYTLWVLVCVVPIKALLSRYVSGVSKQIESSALRGDAWHHLSDAIISAFAFVGISAALLTRDPTADDWAALCVAPIILFGGWKQLRKPVAELLDTAPPPEIEQHVRRVAASVPHVFGVEKCFVRKVGFRYYVDLHVVVRGDLTVRQGHRIAHSVADQVRAQVDKIAEVLVHIEPEEELLGGGHPGELMGEEVREVPRTIL